MIGLSKSVYLRATFAGPWAMRIPRRGHLSYHFMVRGSGVVRMGGRCWTLQAGDFLMVPHGQEHELTDGAPRQASEVPVVDDLPWQPLTPFSASLNDGLLTSSAAMVCGKATCEPPQHPLWRALPDVLHVSKDHGARDLTTLPLELMRQEIERPALGGAAVVRRLAEVVVLGTVRGWLEHAELPAGWLTGLVDPLLGPALLEISREPGKPWTLDGMAKLAGMSRSRFAERFSTIVGQTPSRYLLEARVVQARRLLRAGHSVSEVAWAVGYASEASFGRAYKRHTGESPGQSRDAQPAYVAAATTRDP
ncbi:MAG: AraC family transcriptional regulator [Polyangiaceae bacterium]|nr:AraC family transcriptional regulator [Polyangiaceae bacterium]